MYDCNMDECFGYYENDVSEMLDEYAIELFTDELPATNEAGDGFGK